jgi:hypothetical protein
MTRKVDVFNIEADVPMPEPFKGSLPLDNLEVGESFEFDSELRNKAQSLATRLKKSKGKEFTVRLVNEKHCRVWRTK